MRTKRDLNPRWVLLLAAVWALPAAAAKPDPLALMQKSDKQHRIPSERTVASMVLQSKDGAKRERVIDQIVVQDDQAGDRMRVRFDAPADIAGTTLLSLETPGAGDEQWLYLPAFRKTRRVGEAELGDRFVGTDFYYEDMKRRQVEDYSYTLLGEQDLEGQPCWVIESVPSDPKVKKESPYGKSHVWLRKDNLVAVQLRLFDRRMRPLKEIKTTQLKKVSGDAWRADRVEVTDLAREHRTVVLVKERSVGLELAADVFSQHSLGSN